MKLAHIEKLPVKPQMPAVAKRVRRQAPRYIKSVIEHTRALPNISNIEELRPEQLNALGGGVDAATYLVKSAEAQIIIKLSTHGIEAEAEALEHWQAKGVHVPEVMDWGIVPVTGHNVQKVKYIVQQAMLDKHGRIAETCANFLIYQPEAARKIGRLLGKELKLMHSATAKRTFGEFADSTGNTAPYADWNSYLLGYLDVQMPNLKKLGVTNRQVRLLKQYILSRRFVKRGRYLHGDFSIRNAAIKSYEPLQVIIFDPNPIVGDPTWDIAVLFNNYEFQKRRLQHDDHMKVLYHRDRQLLTGFKQAYTKKIDGPSLQLAQLLQALLQAEYKEGRVAAGRDDKIELKVRQDFIRELVEAMAGTA